MKMSDKGYEFTEDQEGKRYRAYKDTGGVWTNGVGHTGPDVHEGQVVDELQVLAWLHEDMQEAEDEVNSVVKVPLTQNQFDMLCDFEFNTGQLAESTLLKKLNAGDYQVAADQFQRWVYDNGKVQPGLVRRNKMRAERFMEN